VRVQLPQSFNLHPPRSADILLTFTFHPFSADVSPYLITNLEVMIVSMLIMIPFEPVNCFIQLWQIEKPL